MENPIEMDDLGGFPIIFGLTPIYSSAYSTKIISTEWFGEIRAMLGSLKKASNDGSLGGIY